MPWIKALHLLAVFMWIGTLLSLTRLLGYHTKEDADTQMRMAKIYRRMYLFIEFPSMLLTIATGIILLTQLNLSYKPGWFHMKLTFAAGLIICDFLCGRFIRQLNVEPAFGKGVKYKILHGITGLMLIGVILAGNVVRDKKAEIIYLHEHLADDHISVGKNVSGGVR